MSERRAGHRDAGRRGGDRKNRTDERVRARAEDLAQQGMPYQMAMAVAHGRMELNEALERMARRDRVNALMERHELSRALATQVAIGHADLEQVLSRRRLEEHRLANRDRSCLVPGQPLTLALSEGRTAKGQVVSVSPYTFEFKDNGEAREIHKLEVKYGYDPAVWKKIKKGVKVDKKAEPGGAPAVRPQDRYSCSDKRLFGYLDRNIEVVATLLEGERLRGQVSWFGRYEFGMQLRTGTEVIVFRHALADLGPADRVA